MTRRIQLFDSKIWTLLKYKSKIWFLLKYDSKTWTFLKYDSRNWTLFGHDSNKELSTFFWIRSEELNLFSIWLRGLNFLSIWLIEFNIWLKMWLWELNLFFWYDPKDCFSLVTQRNEHFLWIRLKRIEPFHKKKKSKNWTFLTGLKELNLLFLHDWKNWTFFSVWLKELNFLTWRKELNLFFQHSAKNWALWLNLTQRIEPDFQKFDSKNWTFFTKKSGLLSKKNDSKNCTFLKIFWTPRIKNFCVTREMELFFFQFESKTCAFFSTNSLKNGPTPFKTWHLKKKIQIWTFVHMTHRIEPFFLKNMTHRDWTILFNTSQRKWLILEFDLKNILLWLWELNLFSIWLKDWTYSSVWLKELSPSCQYYSKNWTLFLKMSQWIEPFLDDSKELNLDFSNMTERLEPSFKDMTFKELNLFEKCDSLRLTF